MPYAYVNIYINHDHGVVPPPIESEVCNTSEEARQAAICYGRPDGWLEYLAIAVPVECKPPEGWNEGGAG